MRLRNDAAGQALAPIVVVALRARKVELALPAIERLAPGRNEGRRGLILADGDRHAARLAGDVCGDREELPGLVGPRRRFLPLGAANVALLLKIDRNFLYPCFLYPRVAGRHAFHACMAGGACDASRPLLPVPQRFAVEQRESRRTGGLVILHRARLAAHELVARATLGERNLACGEQRGKNSD